ncbi:hypothetical protein AcW1_002160 [Taiwanofungus camphoratus]|nr:hypothetical protein AcV5_010149 [Antrodia cinnamomea]KAI0944454.1 hypothetical protein AcW1_002160 [Antrodia cinnamomea]
MTDTVPPRKTLHAKRSFGKQMRSTLDSPAYDASEEDNDPLTDDAASAVSVSLHAARLPASSSSRPRAQTARQGPARHALAVLVSDDDGGTDSPTYDGDIESSTTQGPDGAQPSGSHSSAPSVASTLTSPVTLPATHLPEPESDHAGLLPPPSHEAALLQKGLPAEPAPAGIAVEAFDPAKLTPADIREFVRRAIAGEGPDGAARPYKINPPPKDRPARIYADGVYDLFHFAHALQLRQAKLAFPPLPASATSPSPSPLATHSTASSGQPSPLDTPVPQGMVPGVYLLVGVNSDEQCVEHKNLAVMSHAERCEAVRHCRWVDEVVPEAPWVIDEDFLQKVRLFSLTAQSFPSYYVCVRPPSL